MTHFNTRSSRKPRRLPLSAAIAAAVLTMGGASALADQNDPEQTQDDKFTLLDQNSDGHLTADELEAREGGDGDDLSAMDTNDDDQVSQSEFAAFERDQESSDQAAGENVEQQASQQASQEESQNQQQPESIAALQDHESLSTFVRALEESGMADALGDETSYTIFAPTNEAFEASADRSVEELLQPENRQELVSLLRAHIVADDVDEEMARRISEARTIDGGTVALRSEQDQLQVGEATVQESAIQEGSLRVYPIDQVLQPQATAGIASADDQGQGGGQTAGTESSRFDALDEDGDGYLSESELEGERGKLQVERGELDTDADGQVSRSEFAAFEEDDRAGGEQPREEDMTEEPWEATGEGDAPRGEWLHDDMPRDEEPKNPQ